MSVALPAIRPQLGLESNLMAEIGQQNRLEILKNSPQGVYLDGAEHGEILLPGALVPDWASNGDIISVFVYRDSEDRIIATTKTPKAKVGEFACLKVVGEHPSAGLFLDWGLEKDLLLPFREINGHLKIGDSAVVYLYLDSHEGQERIAASARIGRCLRNDPPPYQAKDAVDLIIVNETDLGYKAIVDNSFMGMLYKNELSQPLEYGQSLTGYIRQVRSDGKIDLQRDPPKTKAVLPLSEEIFDSLTDADGSLPYNDKTPPEIIREAFNCSKKAFKQAIGVLYKQRRILITDAGIELVR